MFNANTFKYLFCIAYTSLLSLHCNGALNVTYLTFIATTFEFMHIDLILFDISKQNIKPAIPQNLHTCMLKKLCI